MKTKNVKNVASIRLRGPFKRGAFLGIATLPLILLGVQANIVGLYEEDTCLSNPKQA